MVISKVELLYIEIVLLEFFRFHREAEASVEADIGVWQ